MVDITLDHITKIEGHAKLALSVENGRVQRCELSATEGARYFEGIVKGRRWNEPHELTSRICGICSCAHVIAAISAVEDALGYMPSQQTTQLRVLLTLAERIRSHATHLYFLALPDYLGYESALAMAKKYRKEMQHALDMMRVGNLMISTLAARDIHPVSAAVGGWLRLPSQESLAVLARELAAIKRDAEFTARLFSGLEVPDISSKGKWFSLKHAREYAVLEGTFCSGTDSFEKTDYRRFIEEHHEPRSTANFVVKEGKRYMVGALARLNNNHARLSRDAKALLERSGLQLPSTNPYHNNLAQAIELVHCIDHALGICRRLVIQKEPVVVPRMRAGTGIGMIEVPRGTLIHEYALDAQGTITSANIITPTAQNLLNIQEDIREFLPSVLGRPKESIVLDVEKLIRSYDPCFSCSAHFLEVDWLP